MYRSFKNSLSLLLTLLVILTACNTQEPSKNLPRSTPEAEGISSGAILSFLDAIDSSRHEFHSFMLLRHGKVVAEGWWSPYQPDLKHTLYSTSKSFTSTAVGFAVHENLLKTSDKVLSFFPDYRPDSVSPFLDSLSIRDLLMMSAGQDPDPTFSVISQDSNWIQGFFNTPVIKKPGSTFLYNSLATYMAGAIVQKVSGKNLMDFLTPRLFSPLAIEGMDWEVDPLGYSTGGWGLRLRTEDMAKFGQLYLQKGMWNGKQILPESWIEEATSAQIIQSPDAPQEARASSDWLQGYGYQFWRCRHNAFRADGAYGQFIIVMPEQDAVLAITSESPDMQDEINLVWKYIFPAFQKNALPENKSLNESLQKRLSSLSLEETQNAITPDWIKNAPALQIKPEENSWKVQSLQLNFADTLCHLTITIDSTNYSIHFSSGEWLFGETSKPGPNLLHGAKAHGVGLSPNKIAGKFRWNNPNQLELVLRYIESPHTERIILLFEKNKVSIEFQKSQDFGRQGMIIPGSIQEISK